IGALGWNGFLTFGMMYWLIPKMFNTNLYSRKLASTHFLIGTLGIVLYAVPMYWAAFRTYFMMTAFTPEGQLQYQFIDVVQSMVPFYALRAIGGTIYLAGVILMVYNLVKTAKQGKFVESEEASAAPLTRGYKAPAKAHWHEKIERKPVMLLVLSFIVVGIGGLVEMVPTFLIKENVPTIASVKPYTPLELHGRDIYIKEGCNNCHTQMIRPFRYEVARYGEYSKAGESVYDHPHLWGSKRTGPDLARIGGKYPDSWHFNHMLEPASMAPGSVMPPYPWLFEKSINIGATNSKIHAMRKLGVPYEKGYEAEAVNDLKKQAEKITASLEKEKIKIPSDKEIVALIAYLQRLGTDIKAEKTSK
ncbi:MAG: cytochrome-c oxidase, cbb3-type subunit II, partial [Niabella sp.]